MLNFEACPGHNKDSGFLKKLEERLTHSDPETPTDEERLEELFQGLWERVKQAGDLISELRGQKESILGRLERIEAEFQDLQKELTNSRKDVLERNATIKNLQQQVAKDDGRILSNGEKEALAAKARELLARIEGYL